MCNCCCVGAVVWLSLHLARFLPINWIHFIHYFWPVLVLLCIPPRALWVVSVWCLRSRFSLNWIERDGDRKRQRRGDIDRLLEGACCISVSYSVCVLSFHQPTASVKGYHNSQPFGTVKTKRFNVVSILKLLLNANVCALFLPCSRLSLQLLFLIPLFPFLSWISAFVCLIL